VLVLTRKKGERVMIGDDIVVTVIDVRGDGVRIGFDAPRGVSIQRAEVVSAVKDANTGAAASAAQTGELLVGLLNRARKPEPAETPQAATDEPAAEVAPPAAEADEQLLPAEPLASEPLPSEPRSAERPAPAETPAPAPARRPSRRPPKPGPRRP
jgi:carbon storage regulator